MFRRAFNRAAQWAAQGAGRGATFVAALVLVAVWAATGPAFGYSQTWQLVINTGTIIVTFLMVFLLQNTQNRDTAALQIKLDELIRVTREARQELLDLESMPQEDLQQLQQGYVEMAQRARANSGRGQEAGS